MSNNITIQGRLAVDPEIKFSQSGKAMCNVVVPDQKRRKNDAGQWEDASATTWFRATLFGEQAEVFAETAHKGDEVILTGRLITREWTNQQGEVKSSLEVDYATVAIVPRAPQADRVQHSNPQGYQQANDARQQSDPWAGQPQQQGGWGGQNNDPAPF